MKTQITNKRRNSTSRNLEITIWIMGMIIFTLLMSQTSHANNPPAFDEEEYVDDIPFDTEMVVHMMYLPDIDFAEEKNVDDIPFDTDHVVKMYHMKTAMNEVFEMEEEAVVNDIPFNTETVADQAKQCNANDSFASVK
ncbi:MAG: hypothetical protein P8100_06885 [bacterium]